MNWWLVALLSPIALILLMLVVYLFAKMATFGILDARSQHQKFKKESSDG